MVCIWEVFDHKIGFKLYQISVRWFCQIIVFSYFFNDIELFSVMQCNLFSIHDKYNEMMKQDIVETSYLMTVKFEV